MSANDSIPCRVSADLRRYESEQDRTLDIADCMDQAREEVTEKLLEGGQVGRFTFADILDSEIDSNVRATVGEVAELLIGVVAYAQDDHTHVEGRKKVRDSMMAMVERFLDSHPELIEERAAYLASED